MQPSNIDTYFSGLSATIRSVKEVQNLYNPLLAFNFNSLNFLQPGENKYSEILAFFLNPRKAHGQGDLFLKIFLKKVGLDDKISASDFTNIDCECEHVILGNQRRIDILITFDNNKFGLGIENKVWAPDQPNQLNDYNEYLSRKFSGNYCLLYLTPYQKEPSEDSINKAIFGQLRDKGIIKLIGYKQHIVECVHEWAMICQAERVRSFLLDFEQYLKKYFLGEAFMEENKTVADYATQSSENIEVAFATLNAIGDIKKRLLGSLKTQIKEIAIANDMTVWIHPKLGLDDIYTRFSFSKQSWNYAHITFQFSAKNADDFKYGINLRGDGTSKDVPIELPETLKTAIQEKFNIVYKNGDWWVFFNRFENSIKNWSNQSQPWMEVKNGEMKKRINTIVKNYLDIISDLNL